MYRTATSGAANCVYRSAGCGECLAKQPMPEFSSMLWPATDIVEKWLLLDFVAGAREQLPRGQAGCTDTGRLSRRWQPQNANTTQTVPVQIVSIP